MRFTLALLTSLFSITIVFGQNNTPAIPLAYSAFNGSEYNLYVIDAVTGDTLETFASPDYECTNSLSPDGVYLVYTVGSSTPSDHETVIFNRDNGENVQLPIYPYFQGIWSADSTQFAYITRNRQYTLYIYNTFEQEISEIATVDDISSLQWSDGALYFIERQENTITVYQWQNELEHVFDYTLAIDEDSTPVLSPDARYLSYRHRESETDLHQVILDIETGNIILDLHNQQRDHDLIWHPDGTKFILLTDAYELKLYDLTGNTEALIDDVFNPRDRYLSFSSITWSPDGRYLAYNRFIGGGTYNSQLEMNVYDIEEQHNIPVAGFIITETGDLRWVSETQLVYTYAYSEAYPAENAYYGDLYLFDVTRRQRTQLTDTPDISEEFRCRYG